MISVLCNIVINVIPHYGTIAVVPITIPTAGPGRRLTIDCQASTIIECPISYACYTVGDYYTGQACAIRECKFSYAFSAIYNHFLQIILWNIVYGNRRYRSFCYAATGECRTSYFYACCVVIYGHTCQASTIIECIFSYACYAVGLSS